MSDEQNQSNELSLLVDILQAAERIRRFTEGMGREDFLADEKTQSAVIREIIVMGEAGSQIPQVFRDAHTTIPWKNVVQLRHFYVHGYRRLDLKEVWRTTRRFVPHLEKAIRPIVTPPKTQI